MQEPVTKLSRKKILFFFPQNPSLPRSGAQVRCLEILSGLAKLGHEVTFLYANPYPERRNNATTEKYLKRIGIQTVFCFQWSLSEYVISGIIRRAYLMFNRIPPLSSRRYIPRRMHSWFRKIQSEYKPDIIWTNYSFSDSLIDGKSGKKSRLIIDYHDFISINHSMAIAVKHCFSRRHPYVVVNPEVLEESFFTSQTFPLDPVEIGTILKFDTIVAISTVEAEILRRYDKEKKVICLPVTSTAIDLDNTYKGPAIFATGPNAFNLQGFFYFTHRVLPAIQRDAPDFILDVSGSVSGEVSGVPGISLLGFVRNLRDCYRDARFAVCPVLGGTGQQIKIVEAMAHGLPVVATGYASKTSPIIHGENGFVANNVKEFADYCVRLWKDPELCRQMGEAARITVREKFGDNLLRERLSAILESSPPDH